MLPLVSENGSSYIESVKQEIQTSEQKTFKVFEEMHERKVQGKLRERERKSRT